MPLKHRLTQVNARAHSDYLSKASRDFSIDKVKSLVWKFESGRNTVEYSRIHVGALRLGRLGRLGMIGCGATD